MFGLKNNSSKAILELIFKLENFKFLSISNEIKFFDANINLLIFKLLKSIFLINKANTSKLIFCLVFSNSPSAKKTSFFFNYENLLIM